MFNQQFGPFDKYGSQVRDEQPDDEDTMDEQPDDEETMIETPTETITPDNLSPSNELPNYTKQDIWDAIFPPTPH
jgi:hypothetical protein